MVLAVIAGCSRKPSEPPLLPEGKTGKDALLGRLGERWKGDLEEIIKDRRVIRVLVSYSKTNFAVVKGRPQGLEYELLHDYETSLGKEVAGYQESQMDQNVRNRTGAVGILQVLPRTAAEVGIRNVAGVENNIHAGVKYLNYLRETYFNDPDIPPADKVDFALAAYNAGPARIESLRREAAEAGLDPNKWFFNVERVALREIGMEPVQYVADIYKYFIAYKSAERVIREKRIKLQKAEKRDG